MSLFRHRAAIVAALIASLAACNDATPPESPDLLGALTVTTTSDTDTLVIGDTALITFVFRNPADTALTLTSEVINTDDGKPCPVLLPVAAYPETNTVYSFILSTCFGGTDTTLTGQLGLQNISIPARGEITRVVPFTGYTRSSPTAPPRCLTTGRVWILPLFIIDNRPVVPETASDVTGPALLYLKPATATTPPCSNTAT